MSPKRMWFILFLLVLANGIISFAPFPSGIKWLLGLSLLIAPLFLLAKSFVDPVRIAPLLEMDFFQNVPFGLVGMTLVLGLAARFWNLTSLSGWPIGDEGCSVFFSMELLKKWDWNLLVGPIQIPPLYFWIQTLFFHLWEPSLNSLWMFSGLFSLVTLGLMYWALRQFFSPAFSLIGLLFSVFNYWFLLCGRVNEFMIVMVVPLECLTLGLMGMCLHYRKKSFHPWQPFFLGVVTGLNFYVAAHSFLLAFWVAATIGWIGIKERRPSLWAGFGAGFSLTIVPLALYAIRHHYGSYPMSLWFFKATSVYENRWIAPISNITGIFWGARDSTLWGGLLNPLESALVFLGVAFAVKARHLGFMRWLLASFACFMAPGLATNSIEHFRVVLLLPLLVVFLVIGLGWFLTEGLKPAFRGKALWLFLLMCGSVNLFHLFGPYHWALGFPGPVCSRTKSIESWRAYGQLAEIQKALGPGTVFFDFVPKATDSTLPLAVYPFDRGQNPKIQREPNHWVAILVNAQWQEALARRFPSSRWFYLSDHLPLTYGGMVLGVIPPAQIPPALLDQWSKAHEVCREVARYLIYSGTPETIRQALAEFADHYSLFQGDPLLESVYWSKVGNLRLQTGESAARSKPFRNCFKRVTREFFTKNNWSTCGKSRMGFRARVRPTEV